MIDEELKSLAASVASLIESGKETDRIWRN